MTIEHQEDLGFGLITPASVSSARYVGSVTFGKHYAKTSLIGNFYDVGGIARGSGWYNDGSMIDVEIQEATPTHNIAPGDWTCWQNDQELYAKLEQAFINAGFVESIGYPKLISKHLPFVGCWEFKGFNYYQATRQVDDEFRTYRTPEYLLSALNAQPKPKTDKEIEIESIIDYLSLDKKDEWDYAETLYKGGFRVSNVANTERWEQENNDR